MADNLVKSRIDACRFDNTQTSGNCLSIESAWTTEKKFSMDVWIYITGDAQEIASQEGGFSFGIENDMLCYTHPSGGTKTFASLILPVEKRKWTNLLLTYDGSKVQFAVDGIPVGSLTYENAGFLKEKAVKRKWGNT
ncbi:MAG: LamG-like jellyroll fold domain-containing protein [Bacillota bacterium]|nr:LamG-like jellyroll fold domain-containing protein [Bacillota bacterium]